MDQERNQRLQTIASSWQKLNSILISHEAVIQKRWRSKTASKRRAILLNAWPDMVQARRPDWDAWSRDDDINDRPEPDADEGQIFKFYAGSLRSFQEEKAVVEVPLTTFLKGGSTCHLIEFPNLSALDVSVHPRAVILPC